MNQPLLNHATQTMAAGSKSFNTAAKLFDAETRRSVLMLYTWCRHCDDVIDDQTLGFAAETRAETGTEQRLAELQALTRRAYRGEPMSDPAFAAFQEVALAHAIPERQALDHIEGFAMDVRGEHYETIEDTLRYCYHVAGVVGLMMARVMGARDEAALNQACDLGLAFQLTNIARDIVEDAHNGRCYLPARWLHEAGLSPENFAAPHNRERLAGVARRLVNEAEPYYRSAKSGLGALPLRSAWAIATARSVYREIGFNVVKAGPQAWDRRQSTSKAQKLTLLASSAGLALGSRFSRRAPRPAGLWRRPL